MRTPLPPEAIAALDPVRTALLTRATADGDAMVATADSDATAAVTAARAEAAAVVADARAEGERDAAVVREHPDGGVVAEAPGRRLDLRLTTLADRAVDTLGPQLEALWAP